MKTKPRSRPQISSLSNSTRFHNSQNPFDISKLKKVKWKDLDNGDSSNSRPDASSNRCEASVPPRFSAPKTSEYEYFRKFKKDAGHLQSYPPNYNDNQFGEAEEIRNPGGETLEMVKHSSTNNISPFLVEQVTPINFNLFSSTIGPLENSSTCPRMEQEQKGIFAIKREKLQRMVASIFPEVNELTSEGSEITTNTDNSKFRRDIKLRETVDKSRFWSCAFPNTDIHKEKLCISHNRTFVESEWGHFLDDESSKCLSEKSNQSIVPKWDIVVPDPPTEYARKPHIEYQVREGRCDLDSGRTTIVGVESYSAFDFQVETIDFFSVSRVGDIDDYWNPHGPDIGKEPYTLLPRWDSSSMKDEQGRCNLDFGTSSLQTKWRSALLDSSPVSCFAGTDEHWNLCGSHFGEEPCPLLLGSDSSSMKDEQGRCHLDSGRTANLQMERCSSFDLPIKKLGSSIARHIAGTGEHQIPCGPHFGEELPSLILGWDSSSMKDEQDLSVALYNPEQTSYATSPALQVQSYKEKLGRAVNDIWLDSSIFLFNHEFKRHNIEYQKHFVAELNHLPLTMPCNLEHPIQDKDQGSINACHDGDLFNASPNHDKLLGKVLVEKNLPSLQALLPSGLDSDFGWKQLRMTDSSGEFSSTICAPQLRGNESISSYYHTEDKFQNSLHHPSYREIFDLDGGDYFDINNFSARHFRVLFDNGRPWPLLLDKSSWMNP